MLETQPVKEGSFHEVIEIVRLGFSVVGPLTPVPYVMQILRMIPLLSRPWDEMLEWMKLRLRDRMKVGIA